MDFFSRLESRVRQVDSLLCVGLDAHPQDLAAPTAQAARDFCLRLIEATAGAAAAFKPNAAFFEAFGAEGVAALREVIRAVPEGIPVILDAKRGDVASTAQAYARAAFQALGADALTVNPYLGYDAIEPFLEDPERGVFLLCKTSNPGSADLQDLAVQLPERQAGLPGEGTAALYEVVARLAVTWNRRGNLGLVAGATHLQALGRVRAAAPEMWILAPGVGAQGGELQAALRAGLRPDGLGMLVAVSRALSRVEEAGRAAQELRIAINLQREAIAARSPKGGAAADAAAPAPPFSPASQPALLAEGLLKSGCVQFGQFTLKSGLRSPIYIDLRRLSGFPHLLAQVARAYAPLLSGLAFDRLAAVPYAALPIATAISLQSGWPVIYPRKETKDYGTRAGVEGAFAAGERAVVIDDLATTGGSKLEAIEKLASAGLQVRDVVVLIDRQSGAGQALARRGYRLHAVFTLAELLDRWEQQELVPGEQILAVREFLEGAGSGA